MFSTTAPSLESTGPSLYINHWLWRQRCHRSVSGTFMCQKAFSILQISTRDMCKHRACWAEIYQKSSLETFYLSQNVTQLLHINFLSKEEKSRWVLSTCWMVCVQWWPMNIRIWESRAWPLCQRNQGQGRDYFHGHIQEALFACLSAIAFSDVGLLGEGSA